MVWVSLLKVNLLLGFEVCLAHYLPIKQVTKKVDIRIWLSDIKKQILVGGNDLIMKFANIWEVLVPRKLDLCLVVAKSFWGKNP